MKDEHIEKTYTFIMYTWCWGVTIFDMDGIYKLYTNGGITGWNRVFYYDSYYASFNDIKR